MADTNGQLESRPLGVILVVEMEGRLQVPAGQTRMSWQKQLDGAVEYFGGLLSSSSHGLQQYHGAESEAGTSEEDIPFDIQSVFTAFLTRVQLDSIPIQSVGSGTMQDNKNGLGEYTIFIEDAAPNVNGNPAIDETHTRGLDLEVQELVRARRVTRIRAYRVVEFVAAASPSV